MLEKEGYLNKKIEKWLLLERKVVYENPFLTVYEEKLQRGDGKIIPQYYSVKRRDAAFIIALTLDKKVPLVYQYKNGVKGVIWELPAGFVEDGETPETSAKRELIEETGFEAESFELLGKYAPNPSISGNRNFVFLAFSAKKTAQQKLDQNEEIEVKLFDLKQLLKDIRERKSVFIDCQSQLSLLLLGEKLNL